MALETRYMTIGVADTPNHGISGAHSANVAPSRDCRAMRPDRVLEEEQTTRHPGRATAVALIGAEDAVLADHQVTSTYRVGIERFEGVWDVAADKARLNWDKMRGTAFGGIL